MMAMLMRRFMLSPTIHLYNGIFYLDHTSDVNLGSFRLYYPKKKYFGLRISQTNTF